MADQHHPYIVEFDNALQAVVKQFNAKYTDFQFWYTSAKMKEKHPARGMKKAIAHTGKTEVHRPDPS
jgi:hypothetical protein